LLLLFKEKIMKKLLFVALAFAGFSTLNAQSLKTPQPSTTQTIKQEFGLGSIELSYSRPNAKGRDVMGNLVPYGKIWRTGANSATTIAFTEDVTIGGKNIKAGKYGLVTIPGENEWTVILTKDLNVSSPSSYKPENDVVRVMAKSLTMPAKVETFTMQFANVSNSNIELHMRWENIAVALPISTDIDSKVMKQINDAMNVDSKPYFAAAQYYFENGKDLKDARMWIDKAIESNPNAFWMTLLKARIHAKQGDKTGAVAMCNKTMELATTAKNDDYIKMAKELKESL